MDVEIIKKDGTSYRLSEYGVVYDFVVGSIKLDAYTDKVEGRYGLIDYGADYGTRIIKVPMKFKISDGEMHQFAHIRDALYGILTDIDTYYIRELRRPRRLEYEFKDFGQSTKWKAQTDNEYVNGKQYSVRMISELNPDQLYNGGEIEIEFETVELPFAISTYTTMDLMEDDFDIVGKYGLSDNINHNYTSCILQSGISYIWNAGNVAVDPFNMDLEIEIVSPVGSKGFAIANETTNEKLVFNKEIYNDKLIVKHGQILLDNANVLRDTNRSFISLAPGLNKINITGGDIMYGYVDFKYYYK